MFNRVILGMGFIGVVVFIALFLWGKVLEREANKDLSNVFGDFSFYTKILNLPDATKTKNDLDFWLMKSVFKKFSKEEAELAKEMFCTNNVEKCILTELITANYFTFFSGGRFEEARSRFIERARTFYKNNADSCPLAYEITVLNLRLNQVRKKIDVKQQEVIAKQILDDLAKEGGHDFDLNSTACKSKLERFNEIYKGYIFLIAELFYRAGDKRTSSYLLSFKSISNFTKNY